MQQLRINHNQVGLIIMKILSLTIRNVNLSFFTNIQFQFSGTKVKSIIKYHYYNPLTCWVHCIHIQTQLDNKAE